ncbi:MAG: sodium transporter, partial [Caldithrix sp.]
MIDLFIVLAFVIYAITSGLRARKKASENLQEYFLAGKTLTGWRAGFSMAATQFAADTPLLVMGLIATGGIFLVWRLWIYGIAFLMMGFIFSATWRRAGVLTDAELTEVRYSGKGVLPLRVLKAVYYGTVINCVVMAMVLVAAVRIAEVFLPWHEWLPDLLFNPILNFTQWIGVSLGGATGLDPGIATANNLISIMVILSFTALYSTTGGLRSVVATDVVQFSLAMIGTLVYAVIVITKVGGFGNLTSKVIELYGTEMGSKMLSFTPTGGEALMPFLIIIGLQWFFQMNSDGTGYLAQRSMACKTDRDARIAGVIFAWVQIFARSLLWLAIGVGLLVIYPFAIESMAGDQFAASREITFVNGIQDLLPIGIRGLMLTALLAALASTIDTHLNWGASYWSNDIYKRLICEEWLKRDARNSELVIVARLSNILILIIALIIMVNLGSIQKAWFLTLLFGAGMGSVLVLRWLWERINLFSELGAMAASLVVAPILLVVTDVEWIRLGTMAVVTTLIAIGITYFTPVTDTNVLKEFYRRVQPLGFWRKTAILAGDDPNRSIREF